METALMGISEFDDVQAHLLEPEESLDSEQTGIDLDEAPPNRGPGLRPDTVVMSPPASALR